MKITELISIFDDIIRAGDSCSNLSGIPLGKSREGRDVLAYQFGSGKFAISLIGGCHADEPVGPRFLRYFVSFLSKQSKDSPFLNNFSWWIIPHVNPDGEAVNDRWSRDCTEAFDLVSYLSLVNRELPGDDIEFGFPRSIDDDGCRIENKLIADWWRSSCVDFKLHVSLHSMAVAAGPWFLIDPDWVERSDALQESCKFNTEKMGYHLHDVQRFGEKGFSRIAPGFCTRPNSKAMQQFFIDKNQPEMVDKFWLSSMEFMRDNNEDPLTLVSEMPNFITPGMGDVLGPPDEKALWWKSQLQKLGLLICRNNISGVNKQVIKLREHGLRPMPIFDHMKLQWVFIASGMNQVIINRPI